jgi:hypothetical protein
VIAALAPLRGAKRHVLHHGANLGTPLRIGHFGRQFLGAHTCTVGMWLLASPREDIGELLPGAGRYQLVIRNGSQVSNLFSCKGCHRRRLYMEIKIKNYLELVEAKFRLWYNQDRGGDSTGLGVPSPRPREEAGRVYF